MKYKIIASTRMYKRKPEFVDYIQKCTLSKYVNQVEIESGECDKTGEARTKLLQYRSSIIADNCFVFVTEYILKFDSRYFDDIVAPLSEESWDVLCKLW